MGGMSDLLPSHYYANNRRPSRNAVVYAGSEDRKVLSECHVANCIVADTNLCISYRIPAFKLAYIELAWYSMLLEFWWCCLGG